jgi:hypothetical protein
MRSSEIKVTYLLSGTFSRTKALELGEQDSGETWSAAPGQTPVIDGSDKADAAISINSDHISIQGLFVSHFLDFGFRIKNSTDIRLENNSISDIRCSGWNQGGIAMFQNISHVVIRNNTIQDVDYAGIFYGNTSGDKLSDLRIEFNTLNRTCISIQDCGAIHADDRSHSASQIVIANNTIGDHGPESNGTRGIYIDDELSNAVVKNNLIFGTGTYAYQIHGGDHNVFEGNIADITQTQALGLYLRIGDTQQDFGMKGNTFHCNVIYSSGSAPEHLWVLMPSKTDDTLAIHDNIYWTSNGGFSPLLTGDANPHFLDPQFLNPGGKDFRLRVGIRLPPCETIGIH